MAAKGETRTNRTGGRRSARSEETRASREQSSSMTDPFELLEQDHREVEEYFDEYDELSEDGQKAELAEKICLSLKVHTQIEEEIFYPFARKVTKDNDLIDEAIVEHAAAKHLIDELGSMEVGDDLFDAKVRVLGESVKRHIREEEEELFPELESGEGDLEEVGEKLAARKEELTAELQGESAKGRHTARAR